MHAGQEFEGGEEASLMSFFKELTVGGVARPVDTLLMAGLILYGASPFEKAVKSKTRQLAFVFQGIDRLTLIFSQLVIASLAVSTITTLEVAVKWPESVAYVSALFFAVAVIRCGPSEKFPFFRAQLCYSDAYMR